ncbi:30S ribosomal protein S5 [Candidatus Woesearchaeota archaeon]|nr:30S ribosomal protein S5 [Candidatus Woesearchaeota archaeon]
MDEEKVEEAPVDIEEQTKVEIKTDIDRWMPKTALGQKVKNKEITSYDEILSQGKRPLETEIVDALIPEIETELLMIGQSKGKFGGGARRIFKQTQKKTPEGNKPSFSCYVIVGNRKGYIGGAMGKSKDTVPAREKALRKAKLNIFKIKRGCGSWVCGCKEPHSIPFKVEGKCGSVKIILLPAPKGKGLIIEKECQKLLKLAGVKDIWSQTFGQTRQKQNLIYAIITALKKLRETKIKEQETNALGAEQ